ncbi:uncharacterized protein LOC131231500 isoform X2 [Magnolia sinica]|uniref:uncharacterized protein LOC131231500 isoform X2 n=1 Tax=Magnolia sinica TaxID=86752 RepID=UPI00265A5120|nr:uncharacterized protein LOC131231500 isoform X2 [Magnolia sinica]
MTGSLAIPHREMSPPSQLWKAPCCARQIKAQQNNVEITATVHSCERLPRSEDGKIEAEVKITGILSLGALQPEESRKYGTTIAPGSHAPVHQHFFVARMDMTMDCRPGETFNRGELRPFFSLPKVMDGLFSLAKLLFDINIESADGLAPLKNFSGGYCFALKLLNYYRMS